MRKFSKLVKIENDREFKVQDSREFIYNLKRGLLITLKDEGFLNEVQLIYAVKALNKQRKT